MTETQTHLTQEILSRDVRMYGIDYRAGLFRSLEEGDMLAKLDLDRITSGFLAAAQVMSDSDAQEMIRNLKSCPLRPVAA